MAPFDALFSTGNVSADPWDGPARFPNIVNADAALFAGFRSAESAALCRPSTPPIGNEAMPPAP